MTAAITRYLANKGGAKFKSYDQIDKTKEERERGITIAASHVEYETEHRHFSHIDCPGHQNYIKNMIVGAAQMDCGILVVAATSGAQEQTREHLLLAREVGIKDIIVYLNKLDGLENEPELVEMAEEEVRGLLEEYGFAADAPVIKGSARMALEEGKPKIILLFWRFFVLFWCVWNISILDIVFSWKAKTKQKQSKNKAKTKQKQSKNKQTQTRLIEIFNTNFTDSPSKLGAGSMEELVEALDNYMSLPERKVDGDFLMPIEDVFSISGRGTVVTGKVEQGKIKVGDEVETVGMTSGSLKPIKAQATG